jgi:hypothetical protein
MVQPNASSHPAYFTSHQIAKAIEVVVIEIPSEVAISFAHSQYDTHAFQSALLPHCIIR